MPKVKSFIGLIAAIGMLAAGQPVAAAGTAPVGLGTADAFAILAGTPDITNTGASVVTGDLGIHPGLAVSGFPPGLVIGAVHAGDAVALQAKSDLGIAYDDAAGRTPASAITGGVLGGQTLVSGVYNAAGNTLDLTGTITLDGQNDPSSVWIFQATSDLITASSSRVAFINGGDPCNVFWQVTSSATLGSDSTFVGTILALTSITMNSNVTMTGRALARNGTVTLIDDHITRSVCAVVPPPTPTPSATPTATPTPTIAPTAQPTAGPSQTPIATPTASPSIVPSVSPSSAATVRPTVAPTGPPIRNQPVVLLTPRPNPTLPPTDTAPGGGKPGSPPIYAAFAALAALFLATTVVIAKRRPTRR